LNKKVPRTRNFFGFGAGRPSLWGGTTPLKNCKQFLSIFTTSLELILSEIPKN